MYGIFQIPSIPSITSIPAQDFAVLLVIIAFTLTLRLYRGMKGMKYSPTKVYRAPLLYLVIVAVDVFALSPTYIDIIAVIVAVIIGYVIGRRLAGDVKFFEKNNATYYTRSPVILIIWLVSFIARIGIEFISAPGITYLAIAVEVILALTTGLILGEAHHINNSYKQYIKNKK